MTISVRTALELLGAVYIFLTGYFIGGAVALHRLYFRSRR